MALKEVHRRTVKGFGIADLSEISDPEMGSMESWTRVEIWTALRFEPTNKYQNLEWNPDKSFYGRTTISGDESLGYTTAAIRKSQNLEFKIQLIYEWSDDSKITHLLIDCACQKILQSIYELSNLIVPTAIAIIPMPVPQAVHCPARIIRVAPYQDAIIDIIVLAENGVALLEPADLVCSSFVPLAIPDDTPQGDATPNVPDGSPEVPSAVPVPSPPYTPSTGDNGETPQPPVPEPLPGQMARVRFSGTIALCNQRDPFPYEAVSIPFPPPITVDVYVAGNCQSPPIIPFQNIRVTYNGNETYDVLTVLTKLPEFAIEYYYP